MKIKLIFLPVLSIICLSSCNNVPKSSSKLSSGEPYYFIDTMYPPNGKFDKEKTDFMVLKDNLIFGWKYHADIDSFQVSIVHEYEIRGDTLYYYQVDRGSIRVYSDEPTIKFGDKAIYSTLKTKFNEQVEKRKESYYSNRYFTIFGTLDYGLINTPDEYRQYFTYNLAKDFGYAN